MRIEPREYDVVFGKDDKVFVNALVKAVKTFIDSLDMANPSQLSTDDVRNIARILYEVQTPTGFTPRFTATLGIIFEIERIVKKYADENNDFTCRRLAMRLCDARDAMQDVKWSN